MNRQNFKNELNELKNSRLHIIDLEKKYVENENKIKEKEEEMEKILQDNPEVEGKDNITLQGRDFLVAHLSKFILVLDYTLVYNLLKKYSGAFLEFIPIWAKSLIFLICLVAVEETLGYLKKRTKPTPKKEDLDEENDVGKMLIQAEEDEIKLIERQKAERQHRIAVAVSYVFVSILPLISLTEIYSEYYNIDVITAIATEGEEVLSGTNAKLATAFKIAGVALTSLTLHYLILIYGSDILEAKSRNRLRRKLEGIKTIVEELRSFRKKLEARIMTALSDFYNSRKTHILKYGNHQALVSDRFSPFIMDWYNYINGIT